MNALRIRKREKRLAERAKVKAKEANASDFQANQEAAKAAFLARVAGVRLGAKLPNLIEDRYLSIQAELTACRTMISHYEKKKEALLAQQQKYPHQSDLDSTNRTVKIPAKLAIPRDATLIGLAMLTGELEGDAVLYLGTRSHRNKSGYATSWPSGAVSREDEEDDD